MERHKRNRPRSIYQYSNIAPRLSGQTSIFGVVFFVSKSLLGIEGHNQRGFRATLNSGSEPPSQNVFKLFKKLHLIMLIAIR